jgi:hypothetical protein
MKVRSRERILANLEAVYREAYDRASKLGDQERMTQLDSSFQREQLILEVLLDIRDALATAGVAPDSTSALEKLETLRKLTKLK